MYRSLDACQNSMVPYAICMYTYMHIYMYTHIYTQVYIYIYTYVDMHDSLYTFKTIVPDTSSMPQNDMGNYLGLCVKGFRRLP